MTTVQKTAEKNYQNTSTLRREALRSLQQIEGRLREELRNAPSFNTERGGTKEDLVSYQKQIEEDIAWVQHVASEAVPEQRPRPQAPQLRDGTPDRMGRPDSDAPRSPGRSRQ